MTHGCVAVRHKVYKMRIFEWHSVACLDTHGSPKGACLAEVVAATSADWWVPKTQVGCRGLPQLCTLPACHEPMTRPLQRTTLLLRAYEVCVRRPELPRLRPNRLLRAARRLRALRSPQRSARQQFHIRTAAPGDQHLAEQATRAGLPVPCISLHVRTKACRAALRSLFFLLRRALGRGAHRAGAAPSRRAIARAGPRPLRGTRLHAAPSTALRQLHPVAQLQAAPTGRLSLQQLSLCRAARDHAAAVGRVARSRTLPGHRVSS